MLQAKLENKELRRQLKLVEGRSASPFASASPQTMENAVADVEMAELRAQVAEGQVSRPARCSQLPGMLAPLHCAAPSLVTPAKGDDGLYTVLCCLLRSALKDLHPALPPATPRSGAWPPPSRDAYVSEQISSCCCTAATSFPDLQAWLQKLQQECAEAQGNDAKLQSQLQQVHAQLVAGRAPGAPPTPPHLSIATLEATLKVSGCPPGPGCIQRLFGFVVNSQCKQSLAGPPINADDILRLAADWAWQ